MTSGMFIFMAAEKIKENLFQNMLIKLTILLCSPKVSVCGE